MTNSDFTNNAAKHQTRVSNLEAVKRSYVLWPAHRQRLVDDWMELAGVECPTVDLLQPNLASQARFIGVDTSPGTLRKCRVAHRDKQAQWVHGDILDLVLSRAPCMDNVGVLNFDPFLSPGRDLEAALETLGDFAQQRQRDASHFLLIINVTSAYKKTVRHTLQWIGQHFPTHMGAGYLPPDLKSCVYKSKTRPMVNVQIGFGFNPHA